MNASFNRSIGMSPFRLRFGDRAGAYQSLSSLDLNVSYPQEASSVTEINDSIQIVQQIAIFIFILDHEMMQLVSFQISRHNLRYSSR